MIEVQTATEVRTPEILWACVAVIGGVAKHLNEMVLKKEPLNIFVLFAHGFISGFSGWLFAHASVMINNSADFTMISAGVGGYLGIEAIDYLWHYIVRKFK